MSVEALLREIQELQSTGNSVYPKGVFPSQRHHPFLPYKREDDNLFFTASVVKILQDLDGKLTSSEKNYSKEINASALSSFNLFKNKNGLDTYNFWQTEPSRHFPNGLFMHRLKHFQIPDDVDDTALVYLTEGINAERIGWLKNKLKLHSNLAYKKAFNPSSKYQNLKCYSTFFGEKMYIEFDVCVLSNLMSLVLSHPNAKLNEYDHDTLEFICGVVESDEHLTKPFYVAPNYPTTELIFYHLARLLPNLPASYRNRLSEIVKSGIQEQLKLSSGLTRVLLENAAMKLGLNAPFSESDNDTRKDDDAFFFFHAGMITAFENRLAQNLASTSFFHLRYTSKALNRTLLIENMVLKRSLTSE